jgi:hypothetical protein
MTMARPPIRIDHQKNRSTDFQAKANAVPPASIKPVQIDSAVAINNHSGVIKIKLL